MSPEYRGTWALHNKACKTNNSMITGSWNIQKVQNSTSCFLIKINNNQYLQICGISIFMSKSSTTTFILKQTRSKHTYKGIEREF